MADLEQIIEQVRAKEKGRGVVGPDAAASLIREIERLRLVEQELRRKIERAQAALT